MEVKPPSGCQARVVSSHLEVLICEGSHASLWSMTEKDNSESAENRIYELGFHLVSSIPEEKLAAEITALKDVLAANGAAVISEDFPKLKHLTYTMTKVIGPKHLKFNKAYFGWIKFEMAPAALETVKENFGRNENILRFIIVKTVRESTLASIKAPSYRSVEAKPIPGLGGAKKDRGMKSPISEAELDKTIEQLIVE